MPTVATVRTVTTMALRVTVVLTLGIGTIISMSMSLMALLVPITVSIPVTTAVAMLLDIGISSLLYHVHPSFCESLPIVRIHVCELIQVDPALDCWEDLRECVDTTDALLDLNRSVLGNQIDFVQEDLVAERNLLVGLVDFPFFDIFVVQVKQQVLGVCHCDHAIEPKLVGEVSGHERPDDRHRVCHTCCLNDNRVNAGTLTVLGKNLAQSFLEISSDCAAHAAIVHHDHLLC
mmetsp:Transcript_7581/g.12003  ORF Transcript_7581/g.12003 Transcript_7581/m.12003 type:complete len:233 (-) Transcript_7581:586-1284(-)